MLAWWGDVGSSAKTSDSSVIGDTVGFSILPGSDDVYNAKTGQWDKLASGPNYAPNMAYIGWGIYVMARVDSDRSSRRPPGPLQPISAARTSRCGPPLIRRACSLTATRTSTSKNGCRRL